MAEGKAVAAANLLSHHFSSRKCFGSNMKLSYGIMLGTCVHSAWTLLLAGLVLNTSASVVSKRHGGSEV